MVSQAVKNLGFLAIAAGSALAIVAFRDKIFPPTKNIGLEFSNLVLDCVGFLQDGTTWNVICDGSVRIKNIGTEPIQPFFKVFLRANKDGQLEFSNPRIFHSLDFPINPGETVEVFFAIQDHRVDSPATLDYTFELLTLDGVVIVRLEKTEHIDEFGKF